MESRRCNLGLGRQSLFADSFSQLVPIILNLFVNSLINSPYSTISFSSGLPEIPLQSPAQIIDRQKQANEGGMFSAFTNYVAGFANDEPPEPSDQEIEYTLCTVDCVNACSFEQFFKNVIKLPPEALKALVTTLLSRLPEDSSPKIIAVKPDIAAPTPVRPNGTAKAKQVGLTYDPSLVFVLEMSTLLASRDTTTMAECGKDLASALQSVVRDSSHVHPVTLSRAVFYLLSFLRASHDQDFVRAPVVLHTIAKFGDDQLRASAPSIIQALKLCLAGPISLRNEIVNSPDFWLVLEPLQNTQETAQHIFEMIEDIVAGPRPGLTADNYDAVATVLNNFSMSAGQAARAHRQREIEAQRTRQPRPQSEGVQEAIKRGTRAMIIVASMTDRVPVFVQGSQLEPRRAWKTYWSRPLRALQMQSTNPVRAVRAQALGSLQRILLSPNLASVTGNEGEDEKGEIDATWLFTQTLFPLLRHLLKPEVWHTDPRGMGETRLNASLLVCKVFLRFLDVLFASPMPRKPNQQQSEQQQAESSTRSSESADTGNDEKPAVVDGTKEESGRPAAVPIFLETLGLLERLVKSTVTAQQPQGKQDLGNAEALEEAIPESLKNVLLVMSHAGYLVRPEQLRKEVDDEETLEWKKVLWEEIEVRLEGFVKGFLGEVLPPANVESEEATEKIEEQDENKSVADSGVAEKSDESDEKALDDTGGRPPPANVAQEVET